jgi:choline dehydrogenase-like flavoprotein
VFHPGGTTRMGLDATTAVVNRDLRTYAVPNLWVASTSVFPSGASANPTLMLMLLTSRLAERLGVELARG